MIKILTLLIFVLLSVSPTMATTLSDLENIKAPKQPTKANVVPAIRRDAIRDTALSIGAQLGRNERAKEYQKLLDKYGSKFDKVYRFGPLFLKKGVLPPVIDEARNAVVQDSPDTIRFADRIYRIEKPERFVTTVPTWREYLYTGLDIISPQNEVHPLLKPHNEEEQKIWKEYIKTGWDAGFDQADEIFNTNLARLEREYSGMIRYKILRAKFMVSSPVVNSLYRATAGNTKEMSVNDRVYRITGHSKLNLDANDWKTKAKVK